ncbi:hypothetical protein [Polaromonas sp.]|uniref:hypothetical protein n=1 Tax=Polaromonas sp. TaxID=1869339 RepID=UPI00352BACEC
MPEFNIAVTRTQVATAIVRVDAGNQQQAEEKAIEFAHEADFKTQDSTFDLTNGPTTVDAFDGLPTKVLVIEASSTSDFGDSPDMGILQCTPAFLRTLTKMAARAHDMGVDCIQVSPYTTGTNVPVWGPAVRVQDMHLGPETLHITKTEFWFTAYPKHDSHEINTTAINIADLVKDVVTSGDKGVLFYGGYPEALEAQWRDDQLLEALGVREASGDAGDGDQTEKPAA